MRTLGLSFALIFLVTASAFAQDLGTQFPQPPGQRGQRGQAPPSRPAPRRPDGRVSLGPAPGEKGLWVGGITSLRLPEGQQVPYQPWARGVAQDRRQNQLEPHTRCKPSGGPRQFLTPYGVEMVEMDDLKKIFIVDLGGPQTYRVIHIDGRPHPKDLVPSYYGHSIGRWEGDTLIVDTVGFNEKFWLDRGQTVHTEKMHLIERFTRLDMNNMRYQATFDDPGAYTAPWTGEFDIRWLPGDELFEYVCQDNNLAHELMVGTAEAVDRRSQIVP
jgi:hypothetical protein